MTIISNLKNLVICKLVENRWILLEYPTLFNNESQHFHTTLFVRVYQNTRQLYQHPHHIAVTF